MRQLKRSAVAILSTALLGAAGLAVTAAPANAAQNPAASASAAQALTDLNFQYASWSYQSPNPQSPSMGWVYPGPHYVYCYTVGPSVTYMGKTSSTWFLIDDDSGNKNVWVNKVYLDPDSWNVPVPKC
jgi:glucan-binding YG repeat protein